METVTKLVYFKKNSWDDSVSMESVYSGSPNDAPRNVRVYRLEVPVPDDAFGDLHEDVQDGIEPEVELVAEAVDGSDN